MSDLDDIPASDLPWPRAFVATFWPFGCEPSQTPEGWHQIGPVRIVGTCPAGLGVTFPVCPAAEA